MTTWVTADHHFGHTNIIKFCNRPFEDVHHMNVELAACWNEVISPEDDVYYLGDFCMGSAELYVERLAGHIRFLPGSHDKWMRRAVSRSDIWTRHEFLPPIYELDYRAQHVVLCHYAMRTWPRSVHGSYQLYGHSHGRLEATRQPRQMDVGVDCHNFYPVSLDQALVILAKDKQTDAVD